jgi:mRNA interferase RelE/StbE
MAKYKIYFKKSVGKDLLRIPRKDIARILDRIRLLTENPRPEGCEKLSVQENYRIRQGRYRIVYSIQDNQLIVYGVKVAHRKDIYR